MKASERVEADIGENKPYYRTARVQVAVKCLDALTCASSFISLSFRSVVSFGSRRGPRESRPPAEVSSSSFEAHVCPLSFPALERTHTARPLAAADSQAMTTTNSSTLVVAEGDGERTNALSLAPYSFAHPAIPLARAAAARSRRGRGPSAPRPPFRSVGNAAPNATDSY